MNKLKELRIKYKTTGDFKVDEDFDKAIERLANSHGLGFVGSGYDFFTKIRDLEFDNDILLDKFKISNRELITKKDVLKASQWINRKV